ncbi:MAG: twin-arginine translocation signal domain-containing protein [Candidatus Aminicenantes bacterium]|nr:MAG: twin-arginine translocation signal domain-containing protein [Candidatus Aminicenantes bacterium]
MTRRKFLKDCSAITASSLALGSTPLVSCSKTGVRVKESGVISIDPEPKYAISPYLYMQFMEPLGITDGSVEAAWDYNSDDWRADLIEVGKDLAPDTIRWGGAFIRYYKWREGVGPVEKRPPMYNYVWGGKETNRIGTGEFVDFCLRVGAKPLMCVNLLSDGVKAYRNTVHGENRTAGVKEAADWVSYANDPDNEERLSHGVKEPLNMELWQLGNESSYLYEEGFPLDQAADHAKEFAKAMKERDSSIKIVGWGDVRNPEKLRPETPRDDPDVQFWAPEMLKRAGEYLDFIAMHMMGIYFKDDSFITGFEYQRHPEMIWEKLLELSSIAEFRIQAMKEILDSIHSDVGIAVTEGHLSLQPYNANQVLTEWLSAVYHARTMNTYLRHGDRVKICTGADFCGTRWTVNTVMMPVPRGKSFLLPIGSIMRLFKRNIGRSGITIGSCPTGLDIAASRSEDKIFLHVLNMNYNDSVQASFSVDGATITGGKVHEIAPESPRSYVNQNRPDVFDPEVKNLQPGRPKEWTFPATSVSVVELDISV